MNDVLALLREDLRDFTGYRSARSEQAAGTIWLNANELPWPNQVDGEGVLRRYPQPQPDALRNALAALYGCTPAQLLVGRGSDEGIDLLVRAFCTPARDAVLVTPPVFGMYAVCARLHGARLVEAALRDEEDDFHIDLDVVAQTARVQGAKLVFLCSPGNPAGAALASDAVLALARRLRGHAMVVVDEAYIEFTDVPSLAGHIADNGNLVVLRTLSKAHALAAARIGCVIADPLVIGLLRHCQAPYPIPAPCAQQALQALSGQALAQTRACVAQVQAERERLRAALPGVPGVRRVYPAQGNFLLVRFDDAQDAWRRLLAAGIVVRDMRALPQLDDALRISVGTPMQNNSMLAALRAQEDAA